MPQVTKLNVNGIARTIDADADMSLLSALRDQLDLTGTKYGCGEGQCGACTVLIDGIARRSCLTPVSAVGEKQITTIEGLAQGDRLHPLQEAFLEEAAMQCAYCTSGMIMAAVSLLRTNPAPSAPDILRSMEGNICRCGTHPRIVAAIQQAAKAMNQRGKESGQ
jgi:isoquinoline 1-oxidoreductase subunit alpha